MLGFQHATDVSVHVQRETQSFLLLTCGAAGSSSAIRYSVNSKRVPECATSMFLYMLIFMAYHSSRWIPKNQRLKFQIVNAVFTALVLVPQFYVMGRPKSSRYCRQPLLNNLSASIALSFIASGFSVIFTLIEPVPQSLWAAYHVFGLLTCGQGLCTAILTLTAAACAKTTPELYYMSLILTVASIFSTGFFTVRGGLWLTNRLSVTDQSRNNER
ncbi:uncharacterized protein LOC127371169 [Dicentrarchus labrax]|uniref:uncharacterized protein LOC127371169 n=1 Tax=Dicentrarchus labrax TaxID=13489 RepID=UPI0021F5D0F9|nr:uncharacterized protein LOC127371169 [Dicentrarchus labrax]